MTKPTINNFNIIAPIFVQQYEHYLPTAFNESLTLLQKVNKVIEFMNHVGIAVNDVIEQWNNVMDWVMNDGIDETIKERLTEMYEDGTLATIINETIFEDLNRQVSSLVLNVVKFDVKGDGKTDDTENIKKAVQFAYDHKLALHFPAGDYLINDNIPYLHDITTTGEGVLKRKDDTFYITPTFNAINILYTGYGSSASNDGISKDKPMPIAQVRNVLQNLGDKASKGQWRVQFVEGVTYETGIVFNNMPYFAKPLQVWGYYNGVQHLSVWDGTTSPAVYAFRADANNNHLFVEFKDIFFQNWRLSASNAGAIVGWYGVNITTENVKVDNAAVGVWCRGGFSRHYGDSINNCRWGYGFQYSHSGQVGTSSKPRNKITNCEAGVFVGRTSVAHVDYTDFDKNKCDLQVHQKSRIASVNSFFKGWTDRSIWLQGDSLFENDGSTWDENSITDATPIYRLNTGSAVPAIHMGASPYRTAHYVSNNGVLVSSGQSDILISADAEMGSPLRIPKQYLYNAGELQVIIKMRVDVSGGDGQTKTLKLAGANATSQVMAQIDIPPAQGGGLGEVTFELTFRTTGSVLCKARYESNNTALNIVKFSTIGSTVMNGIRDKSADLTLWRMYGSVSGASADNGTMRVFSMTTTLIG